MEFTDRDGNQLRRTVAIDFYDGVNIPQENIEEIKICTYTDVQIGSHHCASYSKDFGE